MHLRRIRIQLLFILVMFVLLVNCDESIPREIEIDVISTKTELRSEPGESDIIKFAIVEYRAKNIGNAQINGWKVFFNVHVNHGPQLMAYESTYYKLEPSEISNNRIVECIIPDYYEDAYKSTLRYVEAW